MKLTEAEMRMVFQIESTNQNAALNEIYMTWRYAPNPATKETAEGLLDKLRPLSDQECISMQGNRLPKGSGILHLLWVSQRKTGVQHTTFYPNGYPGGTDPSKSAGDRVLRKKL